MKIFYSFLLLFCLPAFSDPGDVGNQFCSSPGLGLNFNFESLYKTKCNDIKEDARSEKKCRCLKNEASSNFIIRSKMEESSESGDDYRVSDTKLEYRKRFRDVFDKMTMGAGIQAEILGIKVQDENTPVVGCNASEFSANVKSKMQKNIEIQTKALQDLLDKAQEDLQDCVKNNGKEKCLDEDRLVNNIKNNQNELKNKSPCNLSLNELNLRLKDDPQLLDKISTYYKTLGLDKSVELSAINLVKTEINSKVLCNLLEPAPTLIDTFFRSVLKGYDDQELKVNQNKIKVNNRRLNDKIPEGSEMAGDPSPLADRSSENQCDLGDTFCSAIEANLNKSSNDKKLKYQVNIADCITAAEYETIKGMPGPNLIEAFKKFKRHPGDLLKLPKDTDSDLDRERTSFLRSNPILAKIAMDKESQKKLGSLLHDLAIKLDGKSEPEKLKAYLSFMKNDLKDFVRDNNLQNNTNAFVCNELENSYTAIEIANDPPKLDKKEQFDNDMTHLFHDINRCLTDDKLKAATTNIAETLKTSPLFNLGFSASELDSTQKDYDLIKDKVCSGYNQDYVKKNCPSGFGDECRNKYLKSIDKPIANAIATNSQSIQANLSTQQVDNASRSTDRREQNTEFKSWYKENVSSKFSPSVIATRGEEEDFLREQQRNAQISSAAKPPENLAHPSSWKSSAPVVANGGIPVSPKGSSPSGQQIPDYANDRPSFDPSRLANAKIPQDLIPNFNKLPLNTQKQSLKDVKDFISTKDKSPFDTEDVDEEIKKVDKKIVEKEAKNKSTIASDSQSPIINPSTAASVSVPNVPIPSQSSAFNSATFSGGGFSSSNASGSGRPSTFKDPNKSMNDALVKSNEFIQKNQMPSSVEGRSPASLTTTGSVNFLKGYVDPSSLQPGLLIHEEVLIPYSHDEYEKVKSNLDDLKKYLAENIDVSQIKGSKVYRIKDPQASPESFILFYVSIGDTGSINVKTIDRKKTLKNLNNNFR